MPTKRGACNPNKGHAQRRPPRRHAPQCCLPRGYSPRRYSPALRGHQPGLSSAVVSRAIPSSVRPRPPRRHASGGSRLSRPPRRHASGGSRLSPSSAAWLPPRVRSSRRSAAIGPAVAAQPGIGSDVLLRFAYGVDVGNRDCPLRYCLGYSSYILNRAGATDRRVRVPGPTPTGHVGAARAARRPASGVELTPEGGACRGGTDGCLCRRGFVSAAIGGCVRC